MAYVNFLWSSVDCVSSVLTETIAILSQIFNRPQCKLTYTGLGPPSPSDAIKKIPTALMASLWVKYFIAFQVPGRKKRAFLKWFCQLLHEKLLELIWCRGYFCYKRGRAIQIFGLELSNSHILFTNKTNKFSLEQKRKFSLDRDFYRSL